MAQLEINKIMILTSLCSLLLTKILLPQILINLQLISFWIKLHLSLKWRDSVCLSSRFISAFMCIPLGSALVLDKRIDLHTSITLLDFIRTGQGCLDCSCYLASLWRSQMDRGLIFLFTFVMISVTLLKSRPEHSFLGEPLSHPSILYMTMLNLRSCCKFSRVAVWATKVNCARISHLWYFGVTIFGSQPSFKFL